MFDVMDFSKFCCADKLDARGGCEPDSGSKIQLAVLLFRKTRARLSSATRRQTDQAVRKGGPRTGGSVAGDCPSTRVAARGL